MKNNYKLNIQLFDEPAGNLNTNVTTDAGVSVGMKKFYNKTLLSNAKPNLVYNQFGEKVSVPANAGKKVEWRRAKPFAKALTPLTEGVAPNGKKLEFEAIEKTVEQYGDYVSVSDVLETTCIDDTISVATENSADQAAATLDTITRNEVMTGTQVIYAPNVVGTTVTEVTHRYGLDANAKLTPKLIATAATQLRAMNAKKIDGKFIAVVHPRVAFDIKQDDKWIDVHKYAAATNIFEGEIGEYDNVRFVETTEAKIWKGEDLSEDARNLTVASNASGVLTIDEALTADDAAKLVGREVLIGNVQYKITAAAAGVAGSAKITVASSCDATDGDIVYPGEGGKNGCAVYGTIFLGAKSFGVINIEKNNLEMVIHPKGNGTGGPLEQYSTIGWKAMHAAKILNQANIVRVESGSSSSDIDNAN